MSDPNALLGVSADFDAVAQPAQDAVVALGATARRAVKVDQSIIIARPIEEVFAYRGALENASEWQPDVLTSELAAPGTSGLGARCAERRRGPNGTTEDWDLEITQFEWNLVLGIVARYGPVMVAERHVFARDDRNTRYTLAVEITGSTLTEAAVRKRTVDDLVHLRSQLETPRSQSADLKNLSRRARGRAPDRVEDIP